VSTMVGHFPSPPSRCLLHKTDLQKLVDVAYILR